MKEIDLLPEWYKNSRRHRDNCRLKRIAVCGILLVIIVWNFTAAHSVSKAKKELDELVTKHENVEKTRSRAGFIKGSIKNLREKSDVLAKIDSRMDVASVLGELSFLLDKDIVLNRLSLKGDCFTTETLNKSKNGSTVRTANSKNNNKGTVKFGDIRYKIVIGGIARNAGDVAELICRLEDSAYFSQVVPSFLRNKDIRTSRGSKGSSVTVNEFETSCYLANYELEKPAVARENLEQSMRR